jgi:hypothetical protein
LKSTYNGRAYNYIRKTIRNYVGNKIPKLPIVDENNMVAGMLAVTDCGFALRMQTLT